jgi:hypothetical protein
MLGKDIVKWFTNHPVLNAHFKGVFAADEIPKLQGKLQHRTLAVINTDVLSGAGRHWYVVANFNKLIGRCNYGYSQPVKQFSFLQEVFDSLGSSQEKVEERLGELVGGRVVDLNTTKVQPDESLLCGSYCLYWASNLSVV